MTINTKPLMKLQGSIRECQNACNRSSLCKGVEYSQENGGVCILLRDGIGWSKTFDFYEKGTGDTTDPVNVAKRDSKLMWGEASDRSHDLGGLAMNDVPGATLYKPPSKAQRARKAIRQMAYHVKLDRVAKEVEMKHRLQKAKKVQSR